MNNPTLNEEDILLPLFTFSGVILLYVLYVLFVRSLCISYDLVVSDKFYIVVNALFLFCLLVQVDLMQVYANSYLSPKEYTMDKDTLCDIIRVIVCR